MKIKVIAVEKNDDWHMESETVVNEGNAKMLDRAVEDAENRCINGIRNKGYAQMEIIFGESPYKIFEAKEFEGRKGYFQHRMREKGWKTEAFIFTGK